MRFFIGKVPARDVEMFGEEGLYEYDGDLYYHMIEWGTNPGGSEDFVISDGIGRSIPLSTDHLDALIEAFVDIRDTLQIVEDGKAAEAAIYSEDDIRTYEF